MMSEVRGVPVTCQPGGRGVRDGAGVRVAAPLLHLRRARLRPSKGHRRIGEAEKGFTHSLSKRITPEGSSSPAEHLSDSTFTPVRVPVSNCSKTGLRQLARRAQHTRLRAGRQRHLGVVLVALRRPPADQAARRGLWSNCSLTCGIGAFHAIPPSCRCSNGPCGMPAGSSIFEEMEGLHTVG